MPPQKNIPLMLTAMLSMLVNGTIFGYVITGVMAVINNFDPSAREYFLRINHLKVLILCFLLPIDKFFRTTCETIRCKGDSVRELQRYGISCNFQSKFPL